MAFVATATPSLAKAFYGETLGLRLIGEDPYALVFDANGTMLRVQCVSAVTPAPYTVLGWQVADIAATVDALREAGVRFDRHEGMTQDDRGIWSSPSGARVAWFKDPAGNTLSITQL